MCREYAFILLLEFNNILFELLDDELEAVGG